MKRIVLNYRYWLLAALGAVCLWQLFGLPSNLLPLEVWTFHLLMSKFIGAALACLWFRMMRRWLYNGKLPEITELMNHC